MEILDQRRFTDADALESRNLSSTSQRIMQKWKLYRNASFYLDVDMYSDNDQVTYLCSRAMTIFYHSKHMCTNVN
jgi:hypothetical protein